MPDWLLVGVCAAVGYGVGVRWPRRRLYSATLPSPSVIPPGATPMPGDDDCVILGHRQLTSAERISGFPWRGKVSEIVEATCRDCERPQTQLRIVYPPRRIIRIHQPGHTPGGRAGSEHNVGDGPGGDDAD